MATFKKTKGQILQTFMELKQVKNDESVGLAVN